MVEDPLVSIVIPAFNAEAYLGEALESAIAQTYSRWEAIVVVDSGCRDRTLEVAKSYAAKDARIAVIEGPHERMGASRNRGIAAAKGDFVAFLDADNLFAPQKLEKQMDVFARDPACGISYGRIEHFYNDKPSVRYRNRNAEPIEGDPFKSLLWRNSINLLTVVIRKQILDEFGAFRGEWPALDEQYLWITLARHGARFVFLDAVVGLERLHRDSDSYRRGHIFDTARCFLEMLSALSRELPTDERERYAGDFRSLRRKWRRNLVIGWLMKTPPFAWIVYPWYRRRREKHFVMV